MEWPKGQRNTSGRRQEIPLLMTLASMPERSVSSSRATVQTTPCSSIIWTTEDIHTSSNSSNSPGYWHIPGWKTFTAPKSLIGPNELIKKIIKVIIQSGTVPLGNTYNFNWQAHQWTAEQWFQWLLPKARGKSLSYAFCNGQGYLLWYANTILVLIK